VDSDRVNRWLTLFANFGVLVGLLLLVFEIRQNTDMMKAQMAQARADNRLENYRDMTHSDYWPAISVKGAAANSTEEWLDSLTSEEYQRVRSQTLYEINDLRTQYYLYQNGYLDQRLLDTSVDAQAMRLMRRLSYLGDLQLTDSDFIEYLNTVARKYDLPTYQSGN
jgi:hypothetical protein